MTRDLSATRPPRSRGTSPRLTAAVAAFAVALVSCGGQTRPDPTWVEVGPPAPASNDGDANRRFVEATELFASGRTESALEAFRLFGAEFPTDPNAVRAELYVGRCLSELGDLPGASATFQSLVDHPDGAAARDAAGLYLGFVEALRGDLAAAHVRISAARAIAPDIRVAVEWVAPGDAPLLASLLAESRLTSGDVADAFGDLGLVAATGDPTLRQYAVERAADVQWLLTERELAGLAREGGFPAATTAEAYSAALVAESRTEDARNALMEASPSADELGLGDRVSAALDGLDDATAGAALRYGVVLSLSGPNRRAGRAALGAVLLAQRSFEDREGRSTAVIRDTFGTPEGAENAVRELADLGVAAIIGPIESNLAEQARRVAADVHVPLITLSPSSFTSSRGDTFRWMIDAGAEARVAIGGPLERGAARVFVIDDGGAAEYLGAFAEGAAQAAQDAGATVVERASYDPRSAESGYDAEQLDALARRVVSTRADVVVLALADAQAAAAVAHLAAAEIGAPGAGLARRVEVVLNSFAMTETLLLNSSRYLDGAIIPYWFDSELAAGDAREFADRFEFTFGRSAGTVEAFAFDAAQRVRGLLVDARLDTSTAVARELHTTGRGGVVSPVAFDRDGNPVAAPHLATVRGGRFVALE